MTTPTPANIRVKITADDRARLDSKRARNRPRRQPVAAALVVIAVLALAVFCLYFAFHTPRPYAPALMDEPVYVNKQEGFRFLCPEGWHMHARSEFPRGLAAKEELFLVGYQRLKSEHLATLDVTMLDVPGGASLVDSMTRPGVKGQEWHLKGSFDVLRIGELEAVRAGYEGDRGKQKVIKETLAVRKGERVYFFTAVFSPSDKKARDEVRKALGTLTW